MRQHFGPKNPEFRPRAENCMGTSFSKFSRRATKENETQCDKPIIYHLAQLGRQHVQIKKSFLLEN